MHEDQQRLAAEAEFFDHEEYSEDAIPANTIQRYLECKHPFTPAEFPYAQLGDVRGKRILELGCGSGGNAIILALKGAEVVALDVSPRAIEIARRRAALHGVEGKIEFHALPVEAYLNRQLGRGFDSICGFAVLHHVLPILDEILGQLKQIGHADTVYLFSEPLAAAGWLRKFRLMLPIPVHGTPDERPLNSEDLAILRRRFPGLKLQGHNFLGRVWNRFIGGRVEDYSPLRRGLYHLICRADEALLSLPGGLLLAGSAVMYTSKPK
jgi:SAM-dependent methyltransferase